MRKTPFPIQGIFLWTAIFLAVGVPPAAKPYGLPEAVARARAVYIENETGFGELELVTVLELSKWGRFELAESREKADLILRLDSGSRVRMVPAGEGVPTANNALAEKPVPSGYTRIALLEPKTGQMLWSGKHKTEGGKVKSGHLLDELREAFRDYDKGKRGKTILD